MSNTQKRRLPTGRISTLLCLALVIVAGLSTRIDGNGWPKVIQINAGDALWAVALYLALKFVFNHWRATSIAMCSLLISFAVEFSQIIDVAWLNAIRQTLPGRLVLGSDFVWVDLVRYTVGVCVAFVIDIVLKKK